MMEKRLQMFKGNFIFNLEFYALLNYQFIWHIPYCESSTEGCQFGNAFDLSLASVTDSGFTAPNPYTIKEALTKKKIIWKNK